MRGAKGVVDEYLFAARQFVGEVAIVRFFLMMEAQVLEQDRFAGLERVDHFAGVFANTVRRERDLMPERRRQVLGDGFEAQVGAAFFGAAEMRAKHR